MKAFSHLLEQNYSVWLQFKLSLIYAGAMKETHCFVATRNISYLKLFLQRLGGANYPG
jgi:hypothetical protein